MTDSLTVNPVESLTEPTFEDRARTIIGGLRGAFSTLLDESGADHAGSPTRLSRELGIDTKLAWKILKLVGLENVFEAGQYVPGESAAKVFLKACRKRGVEKESELALRNALADLRELIATHAGSRRAFNTLLASQASDGHSPVESEQRRAAFEANRHIWGVQARTLFRTALVGCPEGGDACDIALLTGYVDLCRMRPNTPWRISQSYAVDGAGQVAPALREPIWGTGPARTGVHRVREFCSHPETGLTRLESPGCVDYVLEGGDVGTAAAQTVVTGETMRSVNPRHRTENFHDLAIAHRVRTPVENFVSDFIVRKDLLGDSLPSPRHYCALFYGTVIREYLELDRLPLREELEEIDLDQASQLDGYEPYGALLHGSFERLDWAIDEFRFFRLQVHFPPVPSVYLVHYLLSDD